MVRRRTSSRRRHPDGAGRRSHVGPRQDRAGEDLGRRYPPSNGRQDGRANVIRTGSRSSTPRSPTSSSSPARSMANTANAPGARGCDPDGGTLKVRGRILGVNDLVFAESAQFSIRRDDLQFARSWPASAIAVGNAAYTLGAVRAPGMKESPIAPGELSRSLQRAASLNAMSADTAFASGGLCPSKSSPRHRDMSAAP